MKYFDKNKNEIKEGMTIQHNNGDIEKVIACGDNNLGINATNPEYEHNTVAVCYPLSEFCLSEWEIIKIK